MAETLGTPKQEIKLFYCYARKDEALRNELNKHLSGLKSKYRLIHLYDRIILPGENWQQAIDKHLNTADLIFLLISPDFIDSDYCYGKEMRLALERHNAGTCCVIPILLRSVYLEDAPFDSIQRLPTNDKSITSWPDPDEAFTDVVKGISATIKAWLSSRKIKNELANTKKPEDEIMRIVRHLEVKGKQPPTIRDLSRYLPRIDVGLIKLGVTNLVHAGMVLEDKSGRSPRYTRIEEIPNKK